MPLPQGSRSVGAARSCGAQDERKQPIPLLRPAGCVQTTGVSGPADSVPAVKSPSGEPREPEKRGACGAEQERRGERRERDRDLGPLVAKDELGREVRVDLLKVRLALRVEVLRARRLGDLPERSLVELGARGPPLVLDERD